MANLVLFLVHLNNPGYKERHLSEEDSDSKIENDFSCINGLTPVEFVKQIMDSSTKAAMNLLKKKKDKN